jgi:hypothetical protein
VLAWLGRWSVAWDFGVDESGPGVDAAGYGLGFAEALILKPGGYGEGAAAVMAEDEDGCILVELLEGALGDFGHGHERGAFDVGGVELPGFADVEQQGGGGGEHFLQVVDGDLKVHGSMLAAGRGDRKDSQLDGDGGDLAKHGFDGKEEREDGALPGWGPAGAHAQLAVVARYDLLRDEESMCAEVRRGGVLPEGIAREAALPGVQRARLPRMLIIILIVLLLAFGGGGYYMGPGLGYYGGGGIDLIILLVILYLLFGRGRERL